MPDPCLYLNFLSIKDLHGRSLLGSSYDDSEEERDLVGGLVGGLKSTRSTGFLTRKRFLIKVLNPIIEKKRVFGSRRSRRRSP